MNTAYKGPTNIPAIAMLDNYKTCKDGELTAEINAANTGFVSVIFRMLDF